MTIKFSIYSDEKLVLAKLSGQITDIELISSFRNNFKNNKDKTNFNQIILLEKTTEFDLETESFIQLSKMSDNFLNNNDAAIKTAFVIDKTMHKVITDTYQSISGAFGSSTVRKTFGDIESALAWLDLDPYLIALVSEN